MMHLAMNAGYVKRVHALDEEVWEHAEALFGNVDWRVVERRLREPAALRSAAAA